MRLIILDITLKELFVISSIGFTQCKILAIFSNALRIGLLACSDGTVEDSG